MSLDSVGPSGNGGVTVGNRMTHSLSTPSGVDGSASTMSRGGKKLGIRVQMLDDSVTLFQVQVRFRKIKITNYSICHFIYTLVRCLFYDRNRLHNSSQCTEKKIYSSRNMMRTRPYIFAALTSQLSQVNIVVNTKLNDEAFRFRFYFEKNN